MPQPIATIVFFFISTRHGKLCDKCLYKTIKTILLVTYTYMKKGQTLMHNCCQEKLFQNEILSITCRDLSHRYFGDFHVVSLEIKCEMDILPRHFKNPLLMEEIKSVIGGKITILRKIQQMGVPSARVDLVKDKIINNFKQNSLPYFTSSSFPAKAILSEIRKSRRSGCISAETIEFLCAR